MCSSVVVPEIEEVYLFIFTNILNLGLTKAIHGCCYYSNSSSNKPKSGGRAAGRTVALNFDIFQIHDIPTRSL